MAEHAEDGARFHAMTKAALGRRIALVFDDTPLSVPVVADPITTGRLQILLAAGETPAEQVIELGRISFLLQSGPLPAQVRILATNETQEQPEAH